MVPRHSRFAAALAAHAVDHVMRERPGARTGRADFLGHGVDNAAYLMDIEQPKPDGQACWQQVVARVPHQPMSEEEQERARRETRLLARLGGEPLPFRVPEVLGLVALEGRLVMVQSACHGVSLPARARGRIEPWTVIAGVAAALHDIDIATWPADAVGPHVTRREHVLSWCADVTRGAPAAFEEARSFVEANLPPDEPGVLLHGDLLPQNLRVDVVEGHPPAALDWSSARVGDPAYDLAIVTRGVRRPFGIESGARRLLEAYNARSARPILPAALRSHELLLRMGFYAQLADDPASAAQRADEVRFIEGLLRRSRA